VGLLYVYYAHGTGSRRTTPRRPSCTSLPLPGANHHTVGLRLFSHSCYARPRLFLLTTENGSLCLWPIVNRRSTGKAVIPPGTQSVPECTFYFVCIYQHQSGPSRDPHLGQVQVLLLLPTWSRSRSPPRSLPAAEAGVRRPSVLRGREARTVQLKYPCHHFLSCTSGTVRTTRPATRKSTPWDAHAAPPPRTRRLALLARTVEAGCCTGGRRHKLRLRCICRCRRSRVADRRRQGGHPAGHP